jgi:hypothetical protein
MEQVAVKRYHENEPRVFYTKRKGRGPTVLTPPVLAVQQLLVTGLETSQVTDRLGIKRDTLSKAMRGDRLRKQARPPPARHPKFSHNNWQTLHFKGCKPSISDR